MYALIKLLKTSNRYGFQPPKVTKAVADPARNLIFFGVMRTSLKSPKSTCQSASRGLENESICTRAFEQIYTTDDVFCGDRMEHNHCIMLGSELPRAGHSTH